jgi:uncharacterized small protein (DUF1192 family)
MREDEDFIKKAPVHQVGQDLSMLSIADLQERLLMLQAEMERVRNMVETKKLSQAQAASFFKT